jgi:hypothetical protein
MLAVVGADVVTGIEAVRVAAVCTAVSVRRTDEVCWSRLGVS